MSEEPGVDPHDELKDELQLSAALSIEALSGPRDRAVEPALAAAAHLLYTADRALHQLVQDARASGQSWTRIGDALGISRQAAQNRFGAAPARRVTRERQAPDPALVRIATDVLDHVVHGRHDRIDALLGPRLRANLGEVGIGPQLAGVSHVFGEYRDRTDMKARVIAQVTVVTAREHRATQDADVRVTLSPHGELMGLFYEFAAATGRSRLSGPGPRSTLGG